MDYRSVFKTGLFKNQLFLVTGGGSGIGRCAAFELASLGAHVVISGRDQGKLERAAEDLKTLPGLRESGAKIGWYVCDIREEDQVRGMVGKVLEDHGRIDGLVNNAGGQFPSPLEKISKNGWEAVVRNNLTGAFLMSREVLNQCFIKQGAGAIVNVLADFRNGMPGMGHSGAARAGVDNLTKTASIEWAKYGVRVNSVAPGIVESSGLGNYDPAFIERMRGNVPKIPLKRLATESEIASSIVFLLTPAARYITGVTLNVDGGLSLRGHVQALEDYGPAPAFDGFAPEG